MKKLVVVMMLAAAVAARGEVSPYAGLWVGSVSLLAVNEVPIAFDENNVAIAPDPAKPTGTGDRADLRLIVHVNAAGEASLIKDVAVVNRNPSGDPSVTVADIAAAGSDEFALSLVTDPSLYVEYPMQRATRYTSVVFDFGDAQATKVLDALVDQVVDYVVATVSGKASSAVDTAAERNQVRLDIVNAVKGWPPPSDDVAAGFQKFLDDLKAANAVPLIAASPSVSGGAAGNWLSQANALAGVSPFNDTRAADLVRAVQGAGTGNDYADAWNAAANAADAGGGVARLLSGAAFGEALRGSAKYAAANPGASAAVLAGLPCSTNAVLLALRSKGTWDNDTRATGALDAMFAAVAAAAASAGGDAVAEEIEAEAYAAGLSVLTGALAAYPAPRGGPTADYSAFVASGAYKGAPAAAADAAAAAALIDRDKNPLTFQHSIRNAAKAAALTALRATYAAAARARLNELPLAGAFGLGNGDPRFMLEIGTGDVLGAAGLTGTIFLPEQFATNPFRHRRHPDHAAGYDITRNIRLDFDAAESPDLIPSVSRGVKSVTGVYREEFFGLHKPLGPGQDIGLKTEGRFQLNRVSTLTTLNGK